LKLVELRPDLGHCWVRYAYRPWPGSPDLWLDLLSRGLGQRAIRRQDSPEPLDLGPLDDVIYLPPVADSESGFRQELAERLVAGGAPVLLQSIPGTDAGSGKMTPVFDVLDAVATGQLFKLDLVPSGAAVIWPLIRGYSDDRSQIDGGLQRLADAGATHVQGVVADLSPADRRRVVDVAGEEGFEELFHGPPPSERLFAAAVHRSGMNPFLPRPSPAAPSRLVNNRRVAGILASIGELWLRLGRTESRGQAFYRAARWVDDDHHDVVAMAREGNLGVVTWLGEESRQVIQESATRHTAQLLEELQQEYLESVPSAGGPDL
jgi:hypothetical protein